MKKGDVVSVVTVSGEYVGRMREWSDKGLVIDDPRMILSNPETGQMGFAKGIAVTGEENPTEVTFSTVVFACKSNDKVTEAHQLATGSIVTPDSKIVS